MAYSSFTNEQLTEIAQNPVVNEALGLTKKDQIEAETVSNTPVRKGGKMRAIVGVENTSEARKIALKHSDVIFRSNDLKLCSPTTKQVLAYTLVRLSEVLPAKGLEDEAYNHTIYKLDLNDYCEARGLKDKKSARATLIKALDDLTACIFEYSYVEFVKAANGQKYAKDMEAKGAILTLLRPKEAREGGYFHRGKCTIEFTNSFIKFMANYGRKYMPFYRALLNINPRLNPYSFVLGYKLQTHRFLRNGYANQNLISVQALIRVCDFNADTYHIAQTIIEPFERDLDNLQALGVIESWEYANAKGQKLSDKQLKSFNLDTWLELYIKFKFKDYPKLEGSKHQHKKK